MSSEPAPLSRRQALRLVEGAYLAATTGLIWLALYYLPVAVRCSGWHFHCPSPCFSCGGVVDPASRECCLPCCCSPP